MKQICQTKALVTNLQVTEIECLGGRKEAMAVAALPPGGEKPVIGEKCLELSSLYFSRVTLKNVNEK